MLQLFKHTQSNGNVKSIRAIPARALPNGPAREVLLSMAANGSDCYAYQPASAGSPNDATQWNIWWLGSRFTLEAWLAEYAIGRIV
jgi:hypothetical protein